MIISPSSAHSFRIPVVGNHVVIICELFVTDGAFSVLLDNLPIQQFPHFSRRSEFPISPRMMRIINASNPRLQSAPIGRLFPAAAGNRFVDWTVLIATKPHDISSNGTSVKSVVGAVNETVSARMGCYNACPRGDYDEPDGSNSAIAEGKTARAHRDGAAQRGVGGPGKSRGIERKVQGISHAQGAEAYVSGRAQENRGGPAYTLGKMEEKQTSQVNEKNGGSGFCNIARPPLGKGVLCNKLLPTTISTTAVPSGDMRFCDPGTVRSMIV